MIYLSGIIQEMITAVQTPVSTFSLPGGTDPLDKVTVMSKKQYSIYSIVTCASDVAQRVEARQQLQKLFSIDFNSLSFAYKTCFTLSILFIIMKDYTQVSV